MKQPDFTLGLLTRWIEVIQRIITLKRSSLQRVGTITKMHECLENVGDVKVMNNFHYIIATQVSNKNSQFKLQQKRAKPYLFLELRVISLPSSLDNFLSSRFFILLWRLRLTQEVFHACTEPSQSQDFYFFECSSRGGEERNVGLPFCEGKQWRIQKRLPLTVLPNTMISM